MEKKTALSTCELHKGQKCKYYCTETACDKPICQSCIPKHERHRVKPIDIAMLEKKKKAEKAKKEGKTVSPAKAAPPSDKKEERKTAVPPKKEEHKVAKPPSSTKPDAK